MNPLSLEMFKQRLTTLRVSDRASYCVWEEAKEDGTGGLSNSKIERFNSQRKRGKTFHPIRLPNDESPTDSLALPSLV